MSKHLIAIVIVLLSSYVFAKDEAVEYEIVPQPHESYEIKAGAVYYRQGNAGIIIEVAEGEDIARYYSERGADRLGNPFLRSPDLGNATVFLVTLINRTFSTLTFTPGLVVLKIKTEAAFPLDFSAMYAALALYPSDVRKILEKSIFHSSEALRPNDVMAKFLLFPPLPRKKTEFRIEMDNIYFENKEVRVIFHFAIVEKKPEPTRH